MENAGGERVLDEDRFAVALRRPGLGDTCVLRRSLASPLCGTPAAGGQSEPKPTPPGGWSASHQGSHAEAAALSRSRTCTTGIACRAGRSRTREEEEGRRGSRAVPRAREQALDVAGKLGERFE